MEKEIKKKLNNIEDLIESAEIKLYYAKEKIYELWDEVNENETVIKNINNLKRELKRDGFYTEELEEFFENYMRYYNK